ncbi:hypothetical protein [Lysobacter sp. GCM10012299]|uniref:hypothetical protein n=1 Tax=Lysobacter sp. GCM10012299 TaxID=3317333 RepID=UPI00360CD448
MARNQIDTFGAYVRTRLEDWGREFALHRDCEYLGHQSKNMLQVLIEHRGEMPPRLTGFKPLEIPAGPQQIEDIVFEIARLNVARATVLRAYYCGKGRRGAERLELANEMLASLGGERLSRGRYFTEHELGVAEVRGVLVGIARAA